MTKIMVQLERPSCSSWMESARSSLAEDYCGNGNLRKFCWNTVGKKSQIGNVNSLTEKKDCSCLCMDDIKLAGKKQNISPTWKILMKDVDLGEPTSFLYHVFLGCTQRECQISKDIVEICRSMCESRFPPGLQKNCQKQKQRGNLMPKHHLHGPMTWKANKTFEQIFKVPTPYMDDHQFKEDEDGSVGELSTVCSQIVVKCLYLVRVWETRYFVVCEQACSCGNECTEACGKRSARSISYTGSTVLWEKHNNIEH